MELEFRGLVAGNSNFDNVSMEEFIACPENRLHLLFDISTSQGFQAMRGLLAIREKMSIEVKPQSNIQILMDISDLCSNLALNTATFFLTVMLVASVPREVLYCSIYLLIISSGIAALTAIAAMLVHLWALCCHVRKRKVT